MATIVTIAGSPSMPSRSAALMAYAQVYLEKKGHTVTVINVRELNPMELISGQSDGPSVMRSRALVEAAQGVIVATPVYRAAYSGVLKTFLDVLPQNALSGKIVLPVVSGAGLVHMLALDYALKPVLAALGAGTILNGVFLIDNQFDYKEGKGFLAQEAEDKFRAVLNDFSDRLR